MRVLIIEDEEAAREHLEHLLQKSQYNMCIAGTASSVHDSIILLEQNPSVDLIFADIHLSDGSAFDLFKKVMIKTPIIFTTAYDEFVLNAFEVQSIAYLLKPITPKKIDEVMHKYLAMGEHYKEQWQNNVDELIGKLSGGKSGLKKRFLVKIGPKYFPLEVSNINAFYRNDLVFLLTRDGKKYPLNESLDVLESQLNPSDFIRVSRQVIIRKTFIKSLEQYTGGKLLVLPEKPLPFDIIVSQEKALWLKHQLS